MGTRADFYVGRGERAEWLGSIAFDGYPSGIGHGVLAMTSEVAYRKALARFFRNRDDVTRPEQGWPWPWKTSQTTDYAYAFDDGKVWASPFGHGWFEATAQEPGDTNQPEVSFPDMTGRQRVAYDRRSGLIIMKLP